MDERLVLKPHSFGAGDRFLHEFEALYLAAKFARDIWGFDIDLVSNKSERENNYALTKPEDTWNGVHEAANIVDWPSDRVFVDADHVGIALNNGRFSWEIVDKYLNLANFFTIDVAAFIDKPANPSDLKDFMRKYAGMVGQITIPSREEPLILTNERFEQILNKYLLSVQMAAETYNHIESAKGKGKFITEVSMDETLSPQSPLEMLIILTALNDLGVPVQTIAPKFPGGKFCKGIDIVDSYGKNDPTQVIAGVMDVAGVLKYAIDYIGLPGELKLSIHTGSDKFSLYKGMAPLLSALGMGWHIKTAGTTWLAELEAIVASGKDGLEFGKRLYGLAYQQRKEFIQSYQHVIDVNEKNLPTPEEVNRWSGQRFVGALMHGPKNESFYDKNFRQILHLGYGIAAKEMREEFFGLLANYREKIEERVMYNLTHNHIKPFVALK